MFVKIIFPGKLLSINSTGLKFYYKEKVNQSIFLQRIYGFFYFFFESHVVIFFFFFFFDWQKEF